MLQKAEQSGELTQEKVIIEATSGNAGIALAWLGHKQSYKVTVVMPDNMSLEKRQLLKIYGAKLILTKEAYGMKAAIDTAREIAAKDKKILYT